MSAEQITQSPPPQESQTTENQARYSRADRVKAIVGAGLGIGLSLLSLGIGIVMAVEGQWAYVVAMIVAGGIGGPVSISEVRNVFGNNNSNNTLEIK